MQRYYHELTKKNHAGYGYFDGRANELIIGKYYRATCCDGQRVKLLRVYNVEENSFGNIDFEYRGRVYMGSVSQLYE